MNDGTTETNAMTFRSQIAKAISEQLEGPAREDAYELLSSYYDGPAPDVNRATAPMRELVRDLGIVA